MKCRINRKPKEIRPPIPAKHLLPVKKKIIEVSREQKKKIYRGQPITLNGDDYTWENKGAGFTIWDEETKQWMLEKLEIEVKK